MASVFIVLAHRYRGVSQRSMEGCIASVWEDADRANAEATRLRDADAADPDPLVRVAFSVEEQEVNRRTVAVGIVR